MKDKSKEAMTIAEASMLMGVSRQFIRVGLQKGILPFGYAVQVSAERFTYFISRKKFYEHTGIVPAQTN
jgi:hypothetical protein